jgi:hypothetical protein
MSQTTTAVRVDSHWVVAFWRTQSLVSFFDRSRARVLSGRGSACAGRAAVATNARRTNQRVRLWMDIP